MKNSSSDPNILILEDDPDQMDLMISFALGEINKLMDDENTSDKQKQKLKSIQIIKVVDIRSLERTVSVYKGSLLAVLDCNVPDAKGGKSHDQLVKTNYKITGQHKPVDIVTEHLPNTPITMISSLNRFQRIVSQYYKSEYDLSLNFIGKSDQSMIKRNIGYYLRQYIKTLD